MIQEKIDFYFDEIKKILTTCFYFNNYDLKGLNEWKRIWKENKSQFFPYFDEDGRKEITINSKEEAKSVDHGVLEHMLLDLEPFCEKLMSSRKYNYGVNIGYVLSYLRNIIYKFTPEEVVNNKIIVTEVRNPERPDKYLPKGTKVSKYVSYLLNYPEIYWLNEQERKNLIDFVNIVYSQFISSMTNFGTVVLSINPLDYLLVSAHTTGWKSCHHFLDGCFRTGGISYMLDRVSMVGYAYMDQSPIRAYNYESSFDWPVKIWRSMVFVDVENRSGALSRQYPCQKDIYAKYLRKLLGRTLADMVGAEYKWAVKLKVNSNISHEEEVDDSGNYYIGSASCFHYMDNVSNVLRLKNGGRNPNINVGYSRVPCVECGNDRRYDEENNPAGSFMCLHCDGDRFVCYHCGCEASEDYEVDGNYYCEDCYYELFGTCSECGETVYLVDAYYYNDDELICSYCRNRYYTFCSRCGELENNSNVRYIADKNEYWCESCVEDYAYYCENCYEYFVDIVEVGDYHYCKGCAEEYLCRECGKYSFDVKEGQCEDCRSGDESFDSAIQELIESVGV